MLRALKHLTLTTSLFAAGATGLYAQSFVTPNAVEYTFGGPKVNPAMNTSCYSLGAGYAYFPDLTPVMGTAYADLYVAGWNNQDIGGAHEVTVLLTESANPSNVMWKGIIPYTKVRDLEVGSMRNTSTNNTNILVAYYQEGVGHFLDIFELTTSATNPFHLIDHKMLSNSPTYGRIRMDGHATYDCAIAWVNTTPGPTKGIQAMVYTNNAWSGITTLSGTATQTGVDIGLTRVNEPVNFSSISFPLNFVYSGGGFIRETYIEMSTLAIPAGTTNTVTPIPNDLYYAGSGLNSRLVLDCADFSTSTTVANGSAWAYTYTDGMQTIVRHRNPTMPAAQTVTVTSGALGNNPLDASGTSYKLFSPALNYGFGYPNNATAQIMVTWYATDGAGFNGYMGVRMDENGTMVTSTPDYLLLPNANTPSIPSGFSSGIALSKTGLKGVGAFLYAAYYDFDISTGDYQLHHAFHKWSDVAFKGNDAQEQSGAIAAEATAIKAYPNPFLDVLHTSVSLQEEGVLRLELHDMAGRLVWEHEAALTKGNHQLNTGDLKKLTAGTYVLTTALNGRRIDTRMVAKQ